MSIDAQQPDPPAKKPDGSAYKAHMEDVARRNAQAQKAGRQQRLEREAAQAASRRAGELRESAELHRRQAKRGKAESR